MLSQDGRIWKDAVNFHGHSCPGLAMGVRAGKIAMKKLNIVRAGDEELIAVAESDGCGVDGIQVMTGCTLGKGNLFYKDYGKQAYTVARRSDNESVRVVYKPFELSEEDKKIREKVFNGEASQEERKEFDQMQERLMKDIMEKPEDDICIVQTKKMKMPEKAKIFKSVRCENCGEYFMEPRGRLQDGKIVCLDCYQEYNREL